MKLQLLRNIIGTNYLIIFNSAGGGYHWRVDTLFFCQSLPNLINEHTLDIESKGFSNVCLVEVKRI